MSAFFLPMKKETAFKKRLTLDLSASGYSAHIAIFVTIQNLLIFLLPISPTVETVGYACV